MTTLPSGMTDGTVEPQCAEQYEVLPSSRRFSSLFLASPIALCVRSSHVSSDSAPGLSIERAVEEGLRLLINVKGQQGIRRLRGKIDWQGDLNEMRESRIKNDP